MGSWWWQWWEEGNGHGGGLVVPSLFSYFLMGLWLVFGWFVAGYLLGLWGVWCHGGCCVVVIGLMCGGGVVERVVIV